MGTAGPSVQGYLPLIIVRKQQTGQILRRDPIQNSHAM
jgi:hypothetical protein